jgi:DNA-directed RNA polymerase specialized sigma24 family protein
MYVKLCRYKGWCIIRDMDDTEIEHELTEAQAAFDRISEIRARRQRAVMAARDAGWSKYRIAAMLNVGAPTVDSIIAAAKRSEAR